jgi:FlaA1/EpsC-like NDP-sugar epimerase
VARTTGWTFTAKDRFTMSLYDRLLLLAKCVIDLAVIVGAFGLAFLVRFDGAIPEGMVSILVVSLPYVLLVKFCCHSLFGLPRLPWRCVSLVEAKRIFLALAASSGVLLLVRLSAAAVSERFPPLGYLQVPVGVLVIDFGLNLLGACGARVGYRLLIEWRDHFRQARSRGRKVRTLLLGSGRAGVRVAREILAQPGCGIQPLGFLADCPSKRGMVIHGLPVLGTVAEVADLIRVHRADQVLVTPSDVPAELVRQLVLVCEGSSARIKVVPEAGGPGAGIDLARVREVSIDDLLRREVVRLNGDTVNEMVRDRTVLVTGAGGSIGSELCRAVCRLRPARLVLVEQAENNQFLIHRELAETFPGVELVPCVADVCDRKRMEQILKATQPEVLFHAAAHKHVPMMEWNPGEAIKNNVLGTRALADLAQAHGVGRFVMVSTDKAVNPTSVMGVAKRVAELYVQALSQRSGTCFVTVRFGNVLGSSGSVIPIFREQILRGGPVTVTHPDMKRYFMTIPEACQLVLEAAAMGKGGEIFVLDMGEPVRIVDLAHDLIRLAGLVPGRDVKINFTGLRPGEKLFEELSLEGEKAGRTRHPRIYIGRLEPQDRAVVNARIEELAALADCGDGQRIRAKFKEIVPEYQYTDAPASLPAPQAQAVGPERRTPVPDTPALTVSLLPGEVLA